MLLARFLFNGCVPLPAELPEEAEEEPLSDDEEFDANTEAEGAGG